MAKCFDGGPRQHPDIREGGPVREYHARSTLTGNADLDGEPAVVGTGIRARRVPSEAHYAAGNVDRAGAGVFQPMPGAAESPARSRAGADAGAEETGGSAADHDSGHSESGTFFRFHVRVHERPCSYSSRASGYESVARSDRGEYRRRNPRRRAA